MAALRACLLSTLLLGTAEAQGYLRGREYWPAPVQVNPPFNKVADAKKVKEATSLEKELDDSERYARNNINEAGAGDREDRTGEAGVAPARPRWGSPEDCFQKTKQGAYLVQAPAARRAWCVQRFRPDLP